MLGEDRAPIVLKLILDLTGVYLTFFFTPGTKERRLQRKLRAPDGRVDVPSLRVLCYASASTRGAGLVLRQIPPLGGADLHRGRSSPHLCAIFFTGAFRRPRELNWMIGVTLIMIAIANGLPGIHSPTTKRGARASARVTRSSSRAGFVSVFFSACGTPPHLGGELPGNEVIHTVLR